MNSPEDRIRKHDYVVIVDTGDEWQDLVGRVEALLDANGAPTSWMASWTHAVVFIPTSPEDDDSGEVDLTEVNDLTRYIRSELLKNDNQTIVDRRNLEKIDPQNL